MAPSPHDDNQEVVHELPDPGDLVLVDLDAQLNRHRSPRQRLISLSVMTSLMVVASVLGLQYAHVLPANLLGDTATPITTPTQHIGAFGNRLSPQQIAISSNIAGGAITLDGTRVAASTYGPFAIATLKKGMNTLTLNVPALSMQTCVISYPANPSVDTCQLINNVDGAPLIALDLSLDALTSAQQQRALTAITRYVNQLDDPTWHATMTAGQHYLAGYDALTNLPSAAVATTTMTAALAVALAAPDPSFADCQSAICPSPYFAVSEHTLQTTAVQWAIEVHTTLLWKFVPATSSGSFTVSATPPVTARSAANNLLMTATQSLRLVMAYDPTHGWNIMKSERLSADQLFQSVCAIGNQLVAAAATAQGINPVEIASTAQPAIAGCRMRFTLTVPGSAPTTPQFLYRFGVLLAGNADAHQIFPALPVATASEDAAVPSAP